MRGTHHGVRRSNDRHIGFRVVIMGIGLGGCMSDSSDRAYCPLTEGSECQTIGVMRKWIKTDVQTDDLNLVAMNMTYMVPMVKKENRRGIIIIDQTKSRCGVESSISFVPAEAVPDRPISWLMDRCDFEKQFVVVILKETRVGVDVVSGLIVTIPPP